MEESEIEALLRRLSDRDPSLRRLQLNCACLGPAQASRILNAIKSNSNLVELQLQQNYLGAEGMTALLSVIDEQQQLRAIDLRYNQLPMAEIKRLWQKLQQNFTLEDVRIDEDLGDEDEVPFQILVGQDAAEADGLTWSTFGRQQLVQYRTKIQELLISNRRIGEVRYYCEICHLNRFSALIAVSCSSVSLSPFYFEISTDTSFLHASTCSFLCLNVVCTRKRA